MRISLLSVALALLLSACQGRRLFTEGATTRTDGASGAPSGPSGRAPRGGAVSLSAKDLLPVDAYVDAGAGASNSRWILADDVIIEASREYFGALLSISSRTGAVHRTDEVKPDETLTTLTFTMGKLQTAVENNPRVMIGTGITVSARNTLKVRLLRTTDQGVPVRLRIVANGNASRGHKDQVAERAPVLQMGGQMRWSGSAWVWHPIG
jgi:hypothetical protein